MACVSRDPACLTLLEAILFFKGFAALVLYRAARMQWKQPLSNSNTSSSNSNSSSSGTATTRFVSLWLQSQASSAFAADIHPGPTIGAAVMFNHGTGIVIEETSDTSAHSSTGKSIPKSWGAIVVGARKDYWDGEGGGDRAAFQRRSTIDIIDNLKFSMADLSSLNHHHERTRSASDTDNRIFDFLCQSLDGRFYCTGLPRERQSFRHLIHSHASFAIRHGGWNYPRRSRRGVFLIAEG